MGLRETVAALLGVSAYQAPPPDAGPDLEDPSVERTRESLGGQLGPLPTTTTRLYLADLESAQYSADNGDIGPAARIMSAARTDCVYSGVLGTLTGGVVRLPRKMHGAPAMVQALEVGHGSIRSVFDEMIPSAESELMISDGEELGIAVGELVPVRGRDFPVLCRLNPEWLYYRWNENRWYYTSIAGVLPIVPGNSRWVLHMPGGRVAPWRNGKWRAIGRAFIPKEHARLYKDDWIAKLAHPARVAVAPAGATDALAEAWFKRVLAWGVNTVFGTRPGWDVKLVESNGRGWESFDKTMERCDREIMIAIAGQIGSTEGGAGFSNKDLFETVRIDTIRRVASSWDYTVNTQILPSWIVNRFGIDSLSRPVVVETDTLRPKDRQAAAQASSQAAGATKAWREELSQHVTKDAGGNDVTPRLDIAQICSDYDVPILGDDDRDGAPDTAGEDLAGEATASGLDTPSSGS